jgi:hypothetical protein
MFNDLDVRQIVIELHFGLCQNATLGGRYSTTASAS